MCTAVRFTDTQGHLFWGRNYDWNITYGEAPVIMPKGFPLKQEFGPTQPTKYATIGMAVINDGYPLYFNCGNEAGLAVGGLNFAQYAQFEPAPIEGKTNIAAFEVPAWIGANFATVDEAQAALEDVAIIAKAPTEQMGVATLHWMIADANRSIVVECQSDGMHVYDNPVDTLTNQPPFPWHMENLRNYMCCNGSWPGDVTWGKADLDGMHVYDNPVDTLTNQPPFPWHMENLRNYMCCNGSWPGDVTWGKADLTPFGTGATMRGIPGDTYSTSRFVKAAFTNSFHPQKETEADNVMRCLHTPFGTGATMRGIPGDTYSTSRFVKAAFTNSFHPQKETEADNVMRCLHTLGCVGFVDGMAAMADGSYELTLFSDCFSANTGTYYFNTYDNPAVRCASLSDAANAPASKLVVPQLKSFA